MGPSSRPSSQTPAREGCSRATIWPAACASGPSPRPSKQAPSFTRSTPRSSSRSSTASATPGPEPGGSRIVSSPDLHIPFSSPGLDGAITVIGAALAAIEAERGVVNDLNVYPVPDGDTGTNLALTVRAVLEELQQSDVEGIPAVAAAVTKGSLMGARGNSGVILSQIVRGLCDVWGRSADLTTVDFKEALSEGATSAYRAVKEPVEGTMLTVVRKMAEAAQSVPDTLGLDKLLVAIEEAGRVAVEKTTEQLPASSIATSSLSRPSVSGTLCAASAILRITVSMVPSTGSLTAR